MSIVIAIADAIWLYSRNFSHAFLFFAHINSNTVISYCTVSLSLKQGLPDIASNITIRLFVYPVIHYTSHHSTFTVRCNTQMFHLILEVDTLD